MSAKTSATEKGPMEWGWQLFDSCIPSPAATWATWATASCAIRRACPAGALCALRLLPLSKPQRPQSSGLLVFDDFVVE